MKRTIWSAVLATLAISIPVSAQDTFRLQIQVYKNGTQVAAPTISATEDQTASLNLAGVGSVTLSPKRLDAERTAVALEVVSEGQTIKPRLVLRGTEPGTVTWQASREAFEVRIAVVR